MKTKFRVLLIDDTESVLDLVKSSVPKIIRVNQFSIQIEIETLHVEMDEMNESGRRYFKISDKTINSLAIVSKEKFDYIFSDFGFIGDKTWNRDLRDKLLNVDRRGVRRSDINGYILQIKDMVNAFYTASANNKISSTQKGWIDSNFINHSGNIIIYTNSPQPFDNYFENFELNIRENEVRDVIKHAKRIEFILMHRNFAITPKIEAAFDDDEDRRRYFAKLLSDDIKNRMEHVALIHMVESQNVLRFKNTRQGQSKIVKLGLWLGAVSAVFGEMLFHFLDHIINDIGVLIKKSGVDMGYHNSILGDSVIFLFLCAIVFIFLRWFAVYIAKKTEDIADILTVGQHGNVK